MLALALLTRPSVILELQVITKGLKMFHLLNLSFKRILLVMTKLGGSNVEVGHVLKLMVLDR